MKCLNLEQPSYCSSEEYSCPSGDKTRQPGGLFSLQWLCCCCLVTLAVVVVGIIWIVYHYMSRAPLDLDFGRQGDLTKPPPKKRKPIRKTLKSKPPPLCSNNLPQEKIYTVVDNDCELVFFGFIYGGVIRYQLPSGNRTWIKLKLLPDGRLPFQFNDCYELQFPEIGIPTVVSAEYCTNFKRKSLIFRISSDKRSCGQSRYKCIEVINPTKKNNIITSIFNQRKWKDPKLAILKRRKTLSTFSVAVMTVQDGFIFRYQNGTGSSWFKVVDPEDKCIAYDNKRSKITVKNCDSEDCPICFDYAI